MADAFRLRSEHQEFKKRNHTSPVWASMAVRQKLTLLDWSTGEDITKGFKRKERNWEVADRLTKDLQIEFTGVEGFILYNFYTIRSIAAACMKQKILKQFIAKLPSRHNVWVLEDRPTR